MKGGYFMVDMDGLNLASSSSQSKTTIYPQLVAALAQGKPVIGYGATYGSGKQATPTVLSVHRHNTTTIYAYTGVLQIAVTASAATVTDLTASTNN